MNFRKVRILYNRRSGPGRSRFEAVRRAVGRHWRGAADRAWYFPESRTESDAMVDAAVADAADCLLVCGGDGTVSSVGRRLIGTGVAMGVVPLGRGNGLARHFGVPLDPELADRIAHAIAQRIAQLRLTVGEQPRRGVVRIPAAGVAQRLARAERRRGQRSDQDRRHVSRISDRLRRICAATSGLFME